MDIIGNLISEKVFNNVVKPLKEKTNVEYNQVVLEDEPVTYLQSKLGGAGYFPIDFDYPVDENGKPLQMLAQINLSQMPSLENFPTKGILQFYIARDDVYGLDFENPTSSKNFKVIYHENVNEHIQQMPMPTCLECDGIIGECEELKISFEKSIMPITADDFRFDKIFVDLYNESFDEDIVSFCEVSDDDYDAINEHLYDENHRVGGYPFFTQCDPRSEGYQDYDIMLLQLSSEDVGDISLMWGDCGVCNFFIKKEDLIKKDFSKVLYNWDCC